MLDHQERHAARIEPVDQVDHLRDLGRVEASHDFVEQDQFRLERERAGDFEPPPLAQREFGGRHLGARLKPDFGQHRARAIVGVRVRRDGAGMRRP